MSGIARLLGFGPLTSTAGARLSSAPTSPATQIGNDLAVSRPARRLSLFALAFAALALAATPTEAAAQVSGARLAVLPNSSTEFLVSLVDSQNRPLANQSVGVYDPVRNLSTYVRTDARGAATYRTSSYEGLHTFTFLYGPSRVTATVSAGYGNVLTDFTVYVGIAGTPVAPTLLVSRRNYQLGSGATMTDALAQSLGRALRENQLTLAVTAGTCAAVPFGYGAVACPLALKTATLTIGTSAVTDFLITAVERTTLPRAEKDAWIQAIRINALTGKTIVAFAINPTMGGFTAVTQLAKDRYQFVQVSRTEIQGTASGQSGGAAFKIRKR